MQSSASIAQIELAWSAGGLSRAPDSPVVRAGIDPATFGSSVPRRPPRRVLSDAVFARACWGFAVSSSRPAPTDPGRSFGACDQIVIRLRALAGGSPIFDQSRLVRGRRHRIDDRRRRLRSETRTPRCRSRARGVMCVLAPEQGDRSCRTRRHRLFKTVAEARGLAGSRASRRSHRAAGDSVR